MKRILSAMIAIALVTGCTKEDSAISSGNVQREFIAGFGDMTKTSFNDGKVDWSQNDIISYYTAKNGPVGQHVVPSDCHSTSFTAAVGEEDTYIVAVYGGTIDAHKGSEVTLTGAIEEVQSGLFKDAHISVSKKSFESGNILNFKNITSIIKFSLTRSDISYVTFNADDGTSLHGDGTLLVEFDEDEIDAVSFPSDNLSRTKIRVNTDGAGTFYLATLPCSIDGFTLRYFDSKNNLVGETVSDKTLTLGTSDMVNLGVLDSRITAPVCVNLSAAGTANCYIASRRDQLYSFNVKVKGSSSVAVDKPKKVRVLWESFGTDEQPSVGDVISYVTIDKVAGVVNFIPYRNGNAVIAVKDTDDEEILWSWHIWVCDGYDPEATEQVYNNSAGTMMDRNLGATSATPGDVGALGLLYQWGRKDPFLGSSSINANTTAASTITWPGTVSSDSDNGTIEYSVQNPTTFITSNSDWYYSSTAENTRWSTSKGMYDPCPVGWKVPDGGDNGVWAAAFGSSERWSDGHWDNDNCGMDFGSGNGQSSSKQLGSALTIWYPAAGYLDKVNGSPNYIGPYGDYWSCTPSGWQAYIFYLHSDGWLYPSDIYYGDRAYGRSVRCVKE